MEIDLRRLQKYIEEGWVMKQIHPILPLTIYNYTKHCSFEKHWDDLTLICRGLVLDDKGTVIARPFEKFFNMEELDEIPEGEYEIFEKMDGSLGIIFEYKGEWIIASRGSFTSDQAVKAKKIAQRYDINRLNPLYTYIVEIIYPINRIVVDYGRDEKLILLGVLDNNSLDDDCPHSFTEIASNISGIPLVNKIISTQSFKELKDNVPDNREGYVIKFKSGIKMKIKGEEYIRLHRIMTDITNYDIYRTMKNDLPIEQLLVDAPDEIDEWVRSEIAKIELEYKEWEYSARSYYKYVVAHEGLTRKEQAELIHSVTPKRYVYIVFKMLDNKSYRKIIFNYIKPEYSKPFSNVGTDSSVYLNKLKD